MIAGIWDEGIWNKYSGRRQSHYDVAVFNRVLTEQELTDLSFIK